MVSAHSYESFITKQILTTAIDLDANADHVQRHTLLALNEGEC
jgi:hypothetical protein